jgi:hypothetical protein
MIVFASGAFVVLEEGIVDSSVKDKLYQELESGVAGFEKCTFWAWHHWALTSFSLVSYHKAAEKKGTR